jgi:hypothetical protein
MPSAATPTPPLFSPAPEVADALLAAVADPTLSFHDLAAALGTTAQALSAWMIRPEIRERLETTDSVITWRTRLTASAQLTAVVKTLTNILANFNARSAPGAPAPRAGSEPDDWIATLGRHDDDPRSKLRALELQLRDEDTARKSAQLLLRLASVRPVAAHDQLTPAIPRATRPASEPAPTQSTPAPPAPEPALAIEELLAISQSLADQVRPPAESPPGSQPAPAPYNTRTRSTPEPGGSSPPSSSRESDLDQSRPARTPTTLRKPTPTHLISAATREHWP